MNTEMFSIREVTREISKISKDVRRAVFVETGEEYDLDFIEDSIRLYYHSKLDHLKEGMHEKFTSPEWKEFRDLATLLETRAKHSKITEVQEAVQMALMFGDESVFNGHKSYSKKKLAAMMEYLVSKGFYIYETNLNKLLFYADLSFFYLRGVGISGSVYHNRPFGPVTDPAGIVLKDLKLAKRVRVIRGTKHIEAENDAFISKRSLGKDEKKVLDWVLDTYGHMSANEIKELSHGEKAYKFTGANDRIAYAYAHFLTYLPPKSLLAN